MATLDEEDAQRLFYIWLILLLPWVVIAPLLAMAFDAPPTPAVYLGVWSAWTYPASVGIVWALKKKKPLIALFPFINIVLFLIAGHMN